MNEHTEAEVETTHPKPPVKKGYRGRNLENNRAWNKEYRLKNLEKVRKWDRERYQRDKEKRYAASRKYALKNPDQVREYKKKWKLRNPEKNRAANEKFFKSESRRKQQAAYRQQPHVKLKYRHKEHRRRAAKRNCERPATFQQLESLKARTKECHYCKKKFLDLHFEHAIPLVRGGPHAIENIVMSCSNCNLSKGKKTPEEFAKYKGLLFF